MPPANNSPVPGRPASPSQGGIIAKCVRLGTPALFWVALLLTSPGCRSDSPSPTVSPGLNQYGFAQAQMGLEFRITLYAPSEAAATTAASAAYARIAALNAVLSDYDADSELSQLSARSGNGQWVTVSADFWHVLITAQELAARSDGAFDITIGPSVNLWRRARRQQEMPGDDLRERMRSRVGYQFLELDAQRQAARLQQPDMRLDAGGIAKGFAMDEALKVLRRHGIHQAMIQGGGDLAVGNPPPGAEGWRIGLTGLAAPGEETASSSLLLSNCALATSGDLNQFVELNGVRYSHIVDPRSGIGMTNRTLVHVIAPHGITADSLSTAISVLGPEPATGIARHYPGVEFRVYRLTTGGEAILDSPGFRRYFAEPAP